MDDAGKVQTWPSSELVAAHVMERYDVGPLLDVRLLRSWTHAVFEVRTTRGRAVLKCYRPGWRGEGEIAWEVDLVDHLVGCGVHVAPVLRSRSGDPIIPIGTGSSAPLAVLFGFAEGAKPEAPFPPELYEREGRAVAALHGALDSFRSDHRRPPLDLAALIDRPLAHILPLVTDASLGSELLATADRIRSRIERLTAYGLDWGPIHGDLTFDNLHLTGTGEFVWYDFDSGGPGWRALDIQGWSVFDRAWHPLGESFVAGYLAVRPLGQADREAAPLLTLAQDVWGLSLDLRYRMVGANEAVIAERLGAEIASLSGRLGQLG